MRIKVATLNVWALPEPIALDVSDRMHAIGERLPHLELDAIALQEVWTGEAREILLGAGRRAGRSHAWHNDATLAWSADPEAVIAAAGGTLAPPEPSSRNRCRLNATRYSK